MEEKKEIKIKLSTVIYLFIIFAILHALGVVYYVRTLKNSENNEIIENETSNVQETTENETTINKIEEEKNQIEEQEEAKIKGEKFNQFDTEFFELKDIAKEYRICDRIKKYKDFNYDLDGDGVEDKITIRKKKDMDIQVWNSEKQEYEVGTNDTFELNEEEFAVHYNHPEIYIVDLNENDKNIEVVIFDQGASDDPNYTIYSKKGNKMVELQKELGYPLKSDKQGTILIENAYNGATSPKIYFEYYTIQNGKIEVKNIDIEKIKGLELKTSYLYFSEDYKNANKIFGENAPNYGSIEENLKILNIEQLKENITFKIKEFTIEENFGYDGYGYKIYVELSDGRKGYVFHIQWAG